MLETWPPSYLLTCQSTRNAQLSQHLVSSHTRSQSWSLLDIYIPILVRYRSPAQRTPRPSWNLTPMPTSKHHRQQRLSALQSIYARRHWDTQTSKTRVQAYGTTNGLHVCRCDLQPAHTSPTHRHLATGWFYVQSRMGLFRHLDFTPNSWNCHFIADSRYFDGPLSVDALHIGCRPKRFNIQRNDPGFVLSMAKSTDCHTRKKRVAGLSLDRASAS